jgi:hypothetical protein
MLICVLCKLILTCLFYSFILFSIILIECDPGRYGYNCNQSCDGCLSDYCDKEDGVCTDTTGCKPGRQHRQPWKCDKGMQIKSYLLIFIHSHMIDYNCNHSDQGHILSK